MEKAASSFHPLDYASVLRRRLWWLVVPLVLALVMAAALIAFLPRTYKTGATIGVAIPVLSQELVGSAQRVTAEERFRSIQQVLMSQPVLERVVREEGFDRNMPMPEAVGLLRSRITPEYPRPDVNLPPGSFTQFTISYSDATPDLAQRVANRIADVFVQESSAKRAIRAEETSMFIATQVEASQKRLLELEERLKQAKEASMGALPEQTATNVAMVTAMQQQLDTTGNAIRGEQDRLSAIERQLEFLRAGAAATAATPGTPAIASSAQARVVTLERQLSERLGTYTDQHPEIVRLRDELASAKAEAAAEASRPMEDRVATLRLDPNYAALIRDRDQATFRINDLKREESRIRSQIATYRNRVELAPRIEQQMATLTREYSLEKDQYANLTAKLRNAETSENMVRNGGGEEFTVLARAPFPTEPDTPDTRRLLMITLLLGMCLGGGLALGREYLDRSIHDARSLDDIDLPVLGEIPRIANA
jgi:polysaccharide chain length determinant protein (PEP-CTERM system associated)